MENKDESSIGISFFLVAAVNRLLMTTSFWLLVFIFVSLISGLFTRHEHEFKGTYLFDADRQLPPSVSVASISTDKVVIQAVTLSEKCTLTTGATIQFIEPLLGDLEGSGVYRIDEPNNNECPDKRFYITMPFKIADEIIKSKQSFEHKVKISKQEAEIVSKAESRAAEKSQ